jgi:Zn-dependent peptidase ImmA (M78 family)
MLEISYVKIIKDKINVILKELDYHEIIIRDDIFKLLRKKSRIIFYPLDDELDLDGFHINKIVNGKLTAFVYINTAKNFEKCIFCAAHELGHIYEIEKNIYEVYRDAILDVDAVMNRFAAELLMPEEAFRTKFSELIQAINKPAIKMSYADILKVIVTLMDYFYVPYKAVVWRMQEIEFLSDVGRKKFEEIEEEDKEIINSYVYEGKFTRLRNPTRLRSFENLPEFLNKADEEGILSKRKSQITRKEFSIDIVASSNQIDKAENSTIEKNVFNEEFWDGKRE